MNVYKIKVNNISCSNCAKTITRGLEDKFEGSTVRVNVVGKQVFIQTTATKEAVYNELAKIGYPASDMKTDKVNLRKYDIYIAVPLAVILLYGMFVHIYDFQFLHFLALPIPTLVFATIIQFYIGRRYYQGAYHSLKKKMLGMDFLVVFSTTLTYFFSLYLLIKYQGTEQVYFEASAIIITIVLIGKTIEERVKDKTNDLLTQLTELTSDEVRLEDGSIADANFVEIGTKYVVNPHEKINMDGTITYGNGSIDEAMVTGESNYVEKTIGDEVIAGTINHGERLIIETTKNLEDNYIYQIIDSVEEASLIDTKYQHMADKVATIFVPVIIGIGILTYLVTLYITNDGFIAFEHAMAVIVISCPCSLGLATPTSIMVSNSISAKLGILYKGAKFFELADDLDVLAFDKTGTLTTGKMEVVSSEVEEEYKPMLAYIEEQSTHPISKAIVEYLNTDSSSIDMQVSQVPGVGITGTNGDVTITVGNPSLLENEEDKNTIQNLESQALTVSVIIVNEEYKGYFALRDKVKEESKEVIDNLKELDITPVLISGDNKQVASYVADQLGIEEYHYKCSPDDKMEILKSMRENGKVIGFVGDGINDSISLKYADVGISVCEGSDIANAASDVTLLQDDLRLVVEGIKLSGLTKRNIKHNFIWAFSYNIIAIPLAATGQLNMVWAAVFMGFSSIIVVLNALNLKREYQKRS